MTTDERVFEARLSEMLHRVTPEPPRTVTVEDVAIRLANQAQHVRPVTGSRGARRPNATGPGRRDGRGRWAPLLAAASVVVVAGASTGIAVALSGSSKPARPADGVPTSVSQPAGQTTGVAVGSTPASVPVGPAPSGKQPWGASPNLDQTVNAGTLAGGDGALFGLTDSELVKLNPATGKVEAQVAYPSGFPNQPPVVAGHTVWLVWDYSERGIELRGFSTGSLAPAGSMTIAVDGAPSGSPDGILAATPGGGLWVAAGSSLKLVRPSSGAVVRSIAAGSPVGAVAVSPDGSRVYAGTADGSSVKVTEYDASSGATSLGSWTAPGAVAGNLVATAGGAWLATSGGTGGQLWFAPAGLLSGARAVVSDSGIDLNYQPTYAGGAVWLGSPQALRCLDPVNGNVLASAPVVRGNGAPGSFGDVAISGGHALGLYLSKGLQAGGATAINPPSACFR